jgi:hypothetical protein
MYQSKAQPSIDIVLNQFSLELNSLIAFGKHSPSRNFRGWAL